MPPDPASQANVRGATWFAEGARNQVRAGVKAVMRRLRFGKIPGERDALPRRRNSMELLDSTDVK
jgi:hypothetical protein